ncbi:hypothetical protein P7C70_g5531, partial [Phenoliferia sp. Uapishka_3]
NPPPLNTGGYQTPTSYAGAPAPSHSPLPPSQLYGAPPPNCSHYSAPQAPVPFGYGAPPSTGYNQAPPQNAPYQQAAGQFSHPAPQQPYGSQTTQPGFSSPAPPSFGHQQQGGAFIPRTYLGVPVHPSDNPLFPASEMMGPQVVVDGYDPGLMAREVEVIRKATKGFGTDQTSIINVLTSMPPLRLAPFAFAYRQRTQRELLLTLEKSLTGHLEDVCMSLARGMRTRYAILRMSGFAFKFADLLLCEGPLNADAHWVEKAISGLGTNEALLTDLVIGRPPSSLALLRAHFTKRKGRTFNPYILDDLSLKTKTCFEIALNAVWSDLPDQGHGPETSAGFGMAYGANPPFVNEGLVQSDMRDMDAAIKLRSLALGSVDPVLVARIVFCRSPVHLNRLQQVYLHTRRTSLTHDVKRGVSGHLQKALLYALEGGKRDTNGCWRDAKMLNATMVGAGTRDVLLVVRLLRAHWDKARFAQIQTAYMTKYGITLKENVRRETSGHYREALLALFNV